MSPLAAVMDSYVKTYADAVLAKGPAVYHPCQETSGTALTDAANGRTGSIVGGAVVDDTSDPAAPTKLGKHIRLDGTDDHLLLNAATTWFTPATAGFTFEGWFYVHNPGGFAADWSRLFDFANASSTQDIWWGDGGGLTNMRATVGSGGWFEYTWPSLATWHHFVLTVNNSGSDTNRAKVYIDGALYAQGNVWAPTNGARANKYIGRSQFGGDAYLPASVTQIAIYNKVLTLAEIAENYQVGVAA